MSKRLGKPAGGAEGVSLLGSIGVVIGMAALLACWGCRSDEAAKKRQQSGDRRVYHVVVRQVVPAPSAQVIEAVKRAIAATKLELEASSMTNIDAVFQVHSALRKEFKVVVLAATHHTTRVSIAAVDKRDKGLANLLFDRIRAGLPGGG